MSNFYKPPTHSDWCTPAWAGDVEKGLGSGYPLKSADQYVWYNADTSLYERRDGKTGKLGTSSADQNADATTVIEAALANLTSGRSHKEIVQLIGPFTIASTINVNDDYTILDLQRAKLTLGADTTMLKFGTTTDLVEQVEVHGGTLDGKKASYDGDIVELYARYTRFYNTTFVNAHAGKQAVIVEGDSTTTQYNWMCAFDHCIFSQNAGSCIYINDWVAYLDINACYLDGTTLAASTGIFCTDPNQHSGGHWIRDCFIYQMNVYGAFLRGSDNWIHDNYFWNIGRNGIVIASDVAWQTYGNIIHDNNLATCSKASTTTYSAILFQDDGAGKPTRNNVHDNTIQQFTADLLDNGIDAVESTYSHFHDNHIEPGCYNAANAIVTGSGNFNRVYANTDFNPIGLLETLAWAGGSPYTCTNIYHTPATLYLYGAAITTVTKAGTTVISGKLANESCNLHLEPGEACIITYAGANPNGVLFGH